MSSPVQRFLLIKKKITCTDTNFKYWHTYDGEKQKSEDNKEYKTDFCIPVLLGATQKLF